MKHSNNPWDLRSDDSRIEDNLSTFIIFTEDKVSERVYFKSFETGNVKVNAIGNQKSKIANVFNAIKHCQDNTLFDEDDKISEEGIQVWCVYDRDFSCDPNETNQNDISFNESLLNAKAHNIKVAWSNDSFELWVLLHFEDVECTEVLLRDRYYDRLTKIMEANEELCKNFSEAIAKGYYSYKDTFKNKRNFKKYVLPELQEVKRRTRAIERAENLEQQHLSKRKAHEKCPCTMVHHLVKELLSCQ